MAAFSFAGPGADTFRLHPDSLKVLHKVLHKIFACPCGEA